jgi:hypothetical protein
MAANLVKGAFCLWLQIKGAHKTSQIIEIGRIICIFQCVKLIVEKINTLKYTVLYIRYALIHIACTVQRLNLKPLFYKKIENQIFNLSCEW